ncbi:MAG: AAA family ATPase [Burkholderiaceae bacterium]|nr:AAA family ATPase [Burkholderiaceae bacterium]
MSSKIKITKLKKLHIKKFRALENLHINIGDRLTIISGKNGTSKSSILGIAAQVFTFRKNYITEQSIPNLTITGKKFESLPEEHFRLSDKFDPPKSMDVDFFLYDGYSEKETQANLELMTRTGNSKKTTPRPQVRGNTTIENKQTSRSFTHPVIYLSLNRLMPIALRGNYETIDYKYIDKNKQEFLALSNKLLNKISIHTTSTHGHIQSTVAHADNYDHDSVSTGEDNAGQIIMAIMSFKKLKEDLGTEYKGGMLLIDEADAGLFPAAQLSLIEILREKAGELNLQIIITTHSPTIIERVYDLNSKHQSYYKNVYLTDSFGGITIKEDWGWIKIYSDIHLKTTSISKEISIPKINIYFEDQEGCDFFNHLLNLNRIKKHFNILNDISLGCGNYINLVKNGVFEFSKHSIIILDGDVENTESLKTIVLLPSRLAPDQLIFEYLYNLPADDIYWTNEKGFTKAIFNKISQDLRSHLQISSEKINVEEILIYKKEQSTNSTKKTRDFFKNFYKENDILIMVKSRRRDENPWLKLISDNPEIKTSFTKSLKEAHIRILTSSYGIDRVKAEQAWS